jgi:prolyl-tRNA synthetase
MGVIAEKFSDEKGLVWPESIAPFKVYLARLGEAPEVVKAADELYESLTAQSVAVLYDDRDARAGAKFADADLLGIPYRLVVSDKTQTAGTFELKARIATESQQVSREQLFKTLDITQ